MIRELILITAFLSFAANAHADLEMSLADRLSSFIRSSLAEKIPNSDIRIPSFQKLVNKKPMSDFANIRMVRLMNERADGIAVFEISGSNQQEQEIKQTIQTPFEAWKKVPVALKRIYPNEKLRSEDFRIQEVNVASGMAREYRGVMVPEDTTFNGLQSKQSILEGQYVISSAIQKSPDVRRGDMVKIELISGDLTLMTQAVVQEPASIGDQVRVLTTKTKKELTGRVKSDRSIEVTL